MLSMQVLRNEETGFAADLWALGCLLYRMLLGSTPFAAASEYLIFERITAHDLLIPDTLAPPARDLLTQLLDSNPSRRIGAALSPEQFCNCGQGLAAADRPSLPLLTSLLLCAGARDRGLSELKEHPFFAGRCHHGSSQSMRD